MSSIKLNLLKNILYSIIHQSLSSKGLILLFLVLDVSHLVSLIVTLDYEFREDTSCGYKTYSPWRKFVLLSPGSPSTREYLKPKSQPPRLPNRLCFILPGAKAETDTIKSHLLLYHEFLFLLLVRLPIGGITFWMPGIFFRALWPLNFIFSPP